MPGKHDRALASIFTDPVRANVAWRDVEALFRRLGAEVSQAEGSRVLVALNGVRAVFHEPHPGKEISKSALRAVREILKSAGEAP